MRLLTQLGKDTDDLVETAPLQIGKNAVETNDNMITYKIVNVQEEIDSVIETVNLHEEKARIVAQDSKLTILFTFLEYSADTVSAICPSHDGYYYLHLDKITDGSYLTHYSFISAIAPVTQGEIEVYKKLFNADYDKENNAFKVLVGNTLYNLSPADMILADQEYDKIANTTNYTAMWANSKAKYIKCHPWFSGFSSDIDLHSAFYGSEEVEAIDLSKEELVVSNMTNAFANCISLQQITGIISLPENNYSVFGAFNKCNKLHSVKLKNLGLDIDFSHSQFLSAESVNYMVQNAKPNTAFVITLNEAVLDKYNSASDWAEVRSSVEANSRIQIK